MEVLDNFIASDVAEKQSYYIASVTFFMII